MNILFHPQEENNIPVLQENEESEDRATVSEVIAMLFMLLLVVVGVVLGLWSAIALYTDSADSGGPIGLLVGFARQIMSR